METRDKIYKALDEIGITPSENSSGSLFFDAGEHEEDAERIMAEHGWMRQSGPTGDYWVYEG